MIDYTLLKDEELHDLVRQHDLQAENELVSRYTSLVKIVARPFFLVGGDSEDLIQEGMFGLLSAVREYDQGFENSFNTFAETCIRNRVLSAVRSAARLKHSPLNDGVSLEEIRSDETQLSSLHLGSSFSRAPEDQVLARESKSDFISSYSRYLSKLEIEIMNLYLDGLSYSDIAVRVNKSQKSVDNAVQRIRRKLARHMKHGDFS